MTTENKNAGVVWRPQPRQMEFMRRPEPEALSGGAAGVLMGLLVVIPFSGLIETGLKLPFLLPGIRETGWLAFAAMAVICLAGPAASAYAVLRLSRVDPATILREGE